MATSPEQFTATVIFGYAWSIGEGTKQTLSYTKTYTNSAGSYRLNNLVVNTALPSPCQLETVGINFVMTSPGGRFTHPALATIATFRPTLPAPHGPNPQATATGTSSSAVNETNSAEAQETSRAAGIISSFVWRPITLSNATISIIVLMVLFMIGSLVRSQRTRQRSSQPSQPKCQG